MGIYVASRASVPERPAMWLALRERGFPIVSSWIDESGEGETECFGSLWERIESEIRNSDGMVLYAERQDFPLKGAFVEVGMALALDKRIYVVLDFEPEGRSFRPIGSWIAHRNVHRAPTVEAAFQMLNAHPGQRIGSELMI